MTAENTSRKRKRNTTDEQYDAYLTEMENDYILRSGIINPSIDPNYLENKWKELSFKLNGVVNGPQLEISEWKKRFKDWKNQTRAKYRKLLEESRKTGGGPPPDIKLSVYEERGVAVWGKVCVTGCSNVEEGGLQQEQRNSNEVSTSPFEMETENITILIDADNETKRKENNIQQSKPKKKRTEVKREPLNKITKCLLDAYERGNNINAQLIERLDRAILIYENAIARKLSLEEERFKFEKAKYKFEDPN